MAPLDDTPFRGGAPSGAKPPLFMIPAMTLWLAAAISVVSVAAFVAPPELRGALLTRLALFPQRWTAGLAGPDLLAGTLVPWVGHIFIHADLRHLLTNLLWLVIFGTPVARRLSALQPPGGRARAASLFFLFFIAAGMAGAVLLIALNLRYGGFLLGASGGVSGLLGGLVRFAFRTRDDLERDPLGFLPLGDRRLHTIAAVIVVLEIVMGGFASKIGLAPPNVGWEAHVGGFLFGLTAFPFFARTALRAARR